MPLINLKNKDPYGSPGTCWEFAGKNDLKTIFYFKGQRGRTEDFGNRSFVVSNITTDKYIELKELIDKITGLKNIFLSTEMDTAYHKEIHLAHGGTTSSTHGIHCHVGFTTANDMVSAKQSRDEKWTAAKTFLNGIMDLYNIGQGEQLLALAAFESAFKEQ